MLERVRQAASRRILFLPHAIRQMSRPERLITTSEVRSVVESGDLIEDYPDDARGHSCLMFGAGEEGRPIHVVCSPRDEFLVIITAYVPSESEWNRGFRKRT